MLLEHLLPSNHNGDIVDKTYLCRFASDSNHPERPSWPYLCKFSNRILMFALVTRLSDSYKRLPWAWRTISHITSSILKWYALPRRSMRWWIYSGCSRWYLRLWTHLQHLDYDRKWQEKNHTSDIVRQLFAQPDSQREFRQTLSRHS